MRPISAEFPVSQEFGSFATAGVVADSQGTQVQQLVASYGNYQPYGHAGQDIACPIGTPVHAIADGTVLYAGWAEDLPGDDSWSTSGYFQRWALYKYFGGIVTVLQHNGWKSVTAHQSTNDAVSVGDRVTEGQIIGATGNTKTRTTQVAPHVHIEALVDDTYSTGNGLIYGRTDPTPYYGGIAAMGSTITPLPEEDTLSQAEVDQLYSAMMTRAAQLEESLTKVINAAADAAPVRNWSYTNPNIPGGDAFQRLRDIPAAVLNQTFKLADGTVTNLAGILTAIHATPSAGPTVVNPVADPQAIVDAIVNGIQITRK